MDVHLENIYFFYIDQNFISFSFHLLLCILEQTSAGAAKKTAGRI